MILLTLASAAVLAASPTPEQARDQADEILQRPEFQEPERNVFEKAVDWIFERIARLLADLLGGDGGSIITWVVLGAVAALIAFVIYRVVRTMRPDPRVRGHAVGGAPERTPADWRAEAERFEAAGSWKAALRARYRALIADLVGREVIRDVPGRTAGEYRAEMASRAPEVSDDFAAASALFEDAWYGDVPTGPDDNREFRARSEQVLSRLGRAARNQAHPDQADHDDVEVPA